MSLTSIVDSSNNNKNTKQKMSYIKRYIDIIDIATARNIYDIVRKNAGEGPMRDTQSNQGVYINIAELDDDLIDTIHNLVEKRVNLVILK